MAARRKSTKKTGATAAQEQKTASARRATRGSAAEGRLSAKRGETVVKQKEKPAVSKVARKRLEKAKVAPSSARSRTKVGRRALTRADAPAKTNKKADRARRKVTTTASGRNPKRVETKLQTKIEQKSRTNVAARVSTQEVKTGAVTPERDKTTSSSSAEAPVMKATSASKEQKSASRETHAAAAKAAKPGVQRQGFKLNEFVVYPAHGVGQIVAIEEQEVAGFKLELFVISFSKDKMTLRVPTSKGAGVGMRKISDPDTAKRSLEILTGRARVKRTMWSRRAQEYEAKINSGDINAIAEVVRDLYRSDAQPEQSYSERQLYEAALDRMVREIAAVQRTSELDALRAVEAQLQRSHGRSSKASAAGSEAVDPEIEEAA